MSSPPFENIFLDSFLAFCPDGE